MLTRSGLGETDGADWRVREDLRARADEGARESGREGNGQERLSWAEPRMLWGQAEVSGNKGRKTGGSVKPL